MPTHRYRMLGQMPKFYQADDRLRSHKRRRDWNLHNVTEPRDMSVIAWYLCSVSHWNSQVLNILSYLIRLGLLMNFSVFMAKSSTEFTWQLRTRRRNYAYRAGEDRRQCKESFKEPHRYLSWDLNEGWNRRRRISMQRCFLKILPVLCIISLNPFFFFSWIKYYNMT